MWQIITVCLQYVLPHHLLSRLVYRASRCSCRIWKNTLIRLFIRRYGVDMSLVEHASPDEFHSFNDFFTRRLNPGARPVAADKDGLVSPVDAAISAVGRIEDEQIFQAKGKSCSLEELVGGAGEYCEYYRDGNFITLYLSPRDYHRVHIPADGELRGMVYIPGRLFSVNAAATDKIDRLFARNERVIATFRSPVGMLSVIFIGALFTGSIETPWHGRITPAGRREYHEWRYAPGTFFQRGDEIGRFCLGSTVIVLTQPNRIAWEPDCVVGSQVVMGQRIGRGMS